MIKYKIIVNPVAGRGMAKRAIPNIEDHLNRLGVSFDLEQTGYPQHAVEIARQAAEAGYPVVAAVGGDGTVNEVIHGLMLARESGQGQAALGIIGEGRGNDFSFGVGVPHDLEKDCRTLAQGHRKPLDIGCVWVDHSEKPRYFGNGIGVGFDTIVGFEAQKLKRVRGFLAYFIGALRTLMFYFTAPTIRLQFNGKEQAAPYIMVSVMNGRRMGGGFMMAPEGDPADGKLNLCLARQCSRWRILQLIGRFMKGTQAGEKEIETHVTQALTIEALSGKLPAHADGETLCIEGHHLKIELIHHALEILVPEEI